MNFTPTHKAAINMLEQIDPSKYASTRNFIGGGTKISPYITRGALTLPQVRDYILNTFDSKKSEKLLFELAWREYWQREWQFRGDSIFEDIKNEQSPVSSTRMPAAIIDANTGIDTLDSQIKQLTQHGYMHNHARMWLAGLVCNIAKTHWWQPSKWLYYYLLDGDPASNSLSWQWVAGTFSSKKYLPAQSNINRYSNSNQAGTYLDKEYFELANIDTPKQLSGRTDLSLEWRAPQTSSPTIDTSLPTFIYHPFWINADWHTNKPGNRILLLQPSWFEKWPSSERVTNFIVDLAKDIPGMQIVVAEFKNLEFGDSVHFKDHPYAQGWNGNAEPYELLFPNVPDKSFNSFMSFWKYCQKRQKP